MFISPIFSQKNDRYKIYHAEKLWEMMNTAFREHRENFPRCRGNLMSDLSKEERRGLVWRERVVCDTCLYHSQMFNLYTEVGSNTRGRKTATANLGLNIALTQTPIAGSDITKLLASGNIEGPSTRGMKNASKLASKVVIEENQADMSQRLQTLPFYTI